MLNAEMILNDVRMFDNSEYECVFLTFGVVWIRTDMSLKQEL